MTICFFGSIQSYGKSALFSKVETFSKGVKTPCSAFCLADTAEFVYFCFEMKTVGRISYWLAAIVVLAAILVSLDYTMVQAVLVSLLFCPCALALEFFMPKARKPIDKIYLSFFFLSLSFLSSAIAADSIAATGQMIQLLPQSKVYKLYPR